jgi:ABC-type transport system substrate-binding protein
MMTDHPLNGALSRRLLLQIGASSLGVLALAACGGSAGVSTPSDNPTAGPATSGSPAPTGGGKPDPAAILRYGQMRGESYDPVRMVAVEDVQLNVLFDTLLSINFETGQLEPRLATDWKIMPDRIRMTLRQGVVFQDGTPFNSDAVKFSVERVLNDPASNVKTLVPMLDHVDVVDPSTVDVFLKVPQPNPLLMQFTTRPGMIVSSTAYKAAGSSDAFSKAPVGAGMYKISGDWHPRESMQVVAWPGYWDKQAALLGGINFNELPMNQRVNDLLAGSADMDGVDGTDVPALKQEPHMRVFTGLSTSVRGLNINLTIEPFTNLQVRQAIAYAIDRDAVVRALTGGLGKPAYQIFTEDSPAYDPALEGTYKYDPAKSKQLLSAAGFPDGLTFKSIIGGTATSYVNFGQLVQAQLKQVGITMNLQLVNQADAIPQLYRLGPDGHGTAASAPIGSGAYARTTDQVLRTTFLKEGFTNPGGVEPPGIRDLIDKAAAALDAATSAALYKQANKMIVDNLYAVIPIYREAAVGALWDYVGGIKRGFTDTDANPDFMRGIFINQGKQPVS